MFNRSLKQTELFKELHHDVAVRLEMDSEPTRHILQRRGPSGLKHIEIRCLAIQQWDRVKCVSVISLHETSGWNANTVTCEEAWAWNLQMVQLVRMERTTTAEE